MTCSDFTTNNIMLGESGNRNFKTQSPSIYYLIGFGLSRHYDSRDAMDEPSHGGDKSAPERQSREPSNPFQTDIYDIGNLVHHEFIKVRAAF